MWGIANRTSSPPAALRNLHERERLLIEWLQQSEAFGDQRLYILPDHRDVERQVRCKGIPVEAPGYD